jgi:glycosyltransferase involved in cell wall biosynthesis
MQRICHSLANAGFGVTLVGRKLSSSKPLQKTSYQQHRLRCFFNKGFAFYAEYNLRLFFFLLTKKMNGICAIDLDTILPCLIVSKLKRVPRIYDAHEYFTELKEVRTRPLVKKFWSWVERIAVPGFDLGYTVSEGLAVAFRQKWGRHYKAIRNLPVLQPIEPIAKRQEYLVYQGAVNEGRGFEYLIPAMKNVPYKLIVCGDGNFMEKLKLLIATNGVQDRVELRGMMLPADLRAVAATASLGIGLAEKEGINQYHALPNKFLEYMHAGLPQVAMNFPEYRKINEVHRVAVLLDSLDLEEIANTINATMEDEILLNQLHRNAMTARELFCWQYEEKELLKFYQQIFCE